MNTQQLLGLLVSTGLLTALLGLAFDGLKLLRAYMGAKTEEIASKTQNATLQRYVTTAEDAIWKAVLQVAQESADDLKEKSADGKLTEDEKKMLKDDATDRAIRMMGATVLKGLDLVYKDSKAWLSATVDAYARASKKPASTKLESSVGTVLEITPVQAPVVIPEPVPEIVDIQEVVPEQQPVEVPAEAPVQIPEETSPDQTPITEGDA